MSEKKNPKPSPKSSKPESAPVKLEGAKFVAEIPPGAKVIACPAGIVAAHPDKPASLNGSNLVGVPTVDLEPPAVPPHVPRPLTAAELARREQVRQNIAMRDRTPVPAPTFVHMGQEAPAATPGSFDSFVMVPGNPHMQLWREFRAGQITHEEMVEAIDADTIGVEANIQIYEKIPYPQKPPALIEDEGKLKAKEPPEKWAHLVAVLRDELAKVMPDVKRWLEETGDIKFRNRANLQALREMLKRQEGKNLIYASRLRAAISTHEAHKGAW